MKSNTIKVIKFMLVLFLGLYFILVTNAQCPVADIHLSPDGQFLYASHRGHDSIVVFKVGEDGQLERIGFESTRGATSRNFTLSPDGVFLLVANQEGNNIVSFKRDIEMGTLSFVSSIDAPNPVCLLF